MAYFFLGSWELHIHEIKYHVDMSTFYLKIGFKNGILINLKTWMDGCYK